MKTMKKIYKRILTLVLAVSLTLTCPVVASAAELDESSVTGDDTSFTECIEYEIIPYDNKYYINTNGSNVQTGAKFEDQFVMSRQEYLVMVLNVQGGTCRMDVDLGNNFVWMNFIDETVTNGTISKISNEKLNAGIKVRIRLYFSGANSNYTLQMWGQP